MGSLQINPSHVVSFYFVAKEQSFSRASERLSVTQPTITQHIQALEVQFGVKLIQIKKKRVHLTKAGERFLPYAETLFNQVVATENFLKAYRFSNLSIGISGPLLIYLGPIIERFKGLHPSTHVSIREGAAPLLEELLDFRLDICLIAPSPPYDDRLRRYRIITEGIMVLTAGSSYPLPSGVPVPWSDLTGHPLIVHSEGASGRAAVLHQFKKRGLQPLIGVEVDNVHFMKRLILENKGVAFMYEPTVRDEISRGDMKIITVEGGEIKLGGIDILVLKETVSPAASAFLKLIKERFGDMLREIPLSSP